LRAIIKFFNLGKRSFGILITLLVLGSLMLVPVQRPVFAAGTECQSSSPESGAYNVTVCITTPAEDTVAIGNTTVTATVNVTGTNPGIQKLEF